MTSNPTRQELEELKKAKEEEINALKSKIIKAKSDLSEIKRKLFRLINNEFPSTHTVSPVRLINKR